MEGRSAKSEHSSRDPRDPESLEKSRKRRVRSPWLRVWLQPKRVTREYLDSSDPRRNALLLSMIASVLNAFDTAAGSNWGDDRSMPVLIVQAVLIGLFVGFAGYYIAAYFLKKVGSWLGGAGSVDEMKVVVGRISGMMAIAIGLTWIPEWLIAGRELFTANTPVLDASPVRTLLFSGMQFLEIGLGVWLFVVFVQATSEVHRFSAWKALLVEIIVIAASFIFAFAVLFILLLAEGPPLGMIWDLWRSP